jgi:DNA-binding IscR family transcriptional regulator
VKISQKGLYALQAMMTLGRRYGTETIEIRDIAIDSDLPETFLFLEGIPKSKCYQIYPG